MKTFTLYYLCSLVILSFIGACSKQIKETTVPDEVVTEAMKPGLSTKQGVIYTESNAADTNSILAYLQNSNGTLSLLYTTESGGDGAGAGLGSQGALQISGDHQWLFAVNAGSNSISSFFIHENGCVTLMATVSSNGVFPVSLTVHNNLLYVVNSTSANISGFTIGSGGSLTLIPGSNQSLSAANAAPAQINFIPGGNYLLVTEKMTNKITRFPVNGSGVAGAGSSITSANTTAFGFDFAGNYAIVSEVAGGAPSASTVSSYAGGVSLTSGPVCAGHTAACRVKTTKDGRYAYVSNTGNNNISLFGVSSGGTVTLINAIAATTGMAPADLTLSSNEFYLYVINGTSHSISEFRKGSNLSLQSIGEITGLPPFAAGLVAR